VGDSQGGGELDPGGVGLMKVPPLAERELRPDDVAVTAYPMGLVEGPDFLFVC